MKKGRKRQKLINWPSLEEVENLRCGQIIIPNTGQLHTAFVKRRTVVRFATVESGFYAKPSIGLMELD